MFDLQLFSILGIIHLLIAAVVCCHILLKKDDVKAAVAWIGLVILSPFVGSLLYYLLGINRVHRKASAVRSRDELFDPHDTALEGTSLPFPVSPPVRQMYRFGRLVHLEDFAGNNFVKPLINGDEAFPEMLSAIAHAEHVIALSTYIFDRDRAGLQFVEALGRARERGVEVRVLIDDVGIRYSKPTVEPDLKEIGVKTGRFLPTFSTRFFRFANLRNHRKIMLVDGRIAFVGGMNIREGNLLKTNPKDPIQDVHFLVRGPIIDQINAVFEEDWLFTTEERVKLPEWPTDGEPADSGVVARVVPEGPDEDIEKLQWLILGALSCAQSSIHVLTPYFLPNEIVSHALRVAALRGIRVQILLPAKSNLFAFDWAMQAGFEQLLETGVEIYLSPAPFDHSKVLVIDQVWALIGSSNWDARSFRLNFEINLECADPKLGRTLCDLFEEKKSRARKVSLSEIRSLSTVIRLRNNLVRLLSPYL